MDLRNDKKEGDEIMAILINDVMKMSEITYLVNKIQTIKLDIVEEIAKIKFKELEIQVESNLIMESLLVEYYKSDFIKKIEMAEESLFLANEAEKILGKQID